MSLLGWEITINDLRCAMVSRGLHNGEYVLHFEEEFATLAQLKAVPWANPTVEVVSATGTVLPSGYGFDLKGIEYDYGPGLWKVTVAVAEQYLGDVTAYAAQVEQLEAQLEQAQTDAATAQGEATQAQAAADEAQELLDIIVNGEEDAT